VFRFLRRSDRYLTLRVALAGLYDMDPPDSQWIDLDRSNPKTGQRDPMGSLCISIQIWPLDKATVSKLLCWGGILMCRR
jgi:hypothetical protein